MKENKVSFVISFILLVVGLLTTAFSVIMSFAVGNPADVIFTADVDLIVYLLLGYYLIINYKKPHGNLLRIIMLVFAASVAINLCGPKYYADGVEAMFACIICGLVCYMAGRLNKEKQSIVISILALLLLLHISHAQITFAEGLTGEKLMIIARIAIYAKPIMWIAICASYFTRFKEHKQAGLE